MKNALEASIPRTLARLQTLLPEFFDGFLRSGGSTTHYLRDTTREFLDFCAPLWALDPRVPAYLIELARHEALQIEIASEPPRQPGETRDLALDAALQFIEAARIVSYRHAVHELLDDPNDRTEPELRETRLFVYRDRDHLVRYLTLSPLAAALVHRWMRGESLRESLISAAAEHRAVLDDALLSGAARLIADLSERGALLGPCQPSEVASFSL